MNIIQIDPNINYPCSRISQTTGFTSLMYLVNNTHDHPEYLEQIKYILDNYPEELNKQNKSGWTALMLACRNARTTSNLETVKLLLSYNPDLYLLRIDNHNVLSISLDNSNTDSSEEVVDLLLDHDFNVDHRMKYGRTVLHTSCIYYKCSENILKKLIDRIDGNIQDIYEMTTLMYAIKHASDYIIEYFLTKDNLDLSILDHKNRTAFHYALVRSEKITNMIKNYTSLSIKNALD